MRNDPLREHPEKRERHNHERSISKRRCVPHNNAYIRSNSSQSHLITLNKHNIGWTAAMMMLALILMIGIVPVQSAINYGRWCDINPTQYAADVSGTLRGVYMRSGGTGAIGAGEGWAVGGDTISGAASPIISHYDGFSWQIKPSPTPAVWTSTHFCTTPGAPGVGLCNPNGDGTDGWIVGGSDLNPSLSVPLALYWAGPSSGLTPVNPPVPYTTAHGILNSVFMVCHSPPYGSGCPGGAAFSPGLTIAVGSDGANGVIYQLSGDPLHGAGWVFQTVTGDPTSAYNSVYMYVDQTGNLAGFAVGNNGVIATYSGTWHATALTGASNLLGVFVDQANPADAVAVGTGGQIWHYFSGIWHGPTTPMGTSVDLTGVFMTSSSEGWVVGTQSAILHTTNLSGNIWLPLGTPAQTATGTGVDLHGISFPSGGNGWAVGESGVILHTENSACGTISSPCWGGSTSITQVASGGAGQQLNTVFMKGSNDTWLVGCSTQLAAKIH